MRRARTTAILAATLGLAALAGCASAPVPAPKVARGVALVVPDATRPYAAADTAFGLISGAWCASQPGANPCSRPPCWPPRWAWPTSGHAGRPPRSWPGCFTCRARRLPQAAPRGARAAGRAARPAGGAARGGRARGHAGGQRPGVGRPGPAAAAGVPGRRGDRLRRRSEPGAVLDESLARRQPDQRRDRPGHPRADHEAGQRLLDNIGWVLTSALYLNAAWDVPFAASDTQPGPFTPATGGPVTAQFMHGYSVRAAESGGWTGVSLPYKGGRLAMLALLPPAGAGNCARPAAADLAAIAGGVQGKAAAEVAVGFPKLSIGSNARMDAELKKLGMAPASATSPGCRGWRARSCNRRQRSGSARGALSPPRPPPSGSPPRRARAVTREVDFNRPYLLLVTDTRTGEPLFLAKVASPAQ